MRKFFWTFVPGLVSGAIFAYLGYLAGGYIMSNTALWIPILPGAMGGLGCGQVSNRRSPARGVVNGLICMGITIYAQFMLFHPPFDFDGSFLGYLAQLHKLPILTLILIAINGLIAGWWGREERIRSGRVKPQSPAESREP